MLKSFLLLFVFLGFSPQFFAQEKSQTIKIAILQTGEHSETFVQEFAEKLVRAQSNFQLLDLDLAAAATRGAKETKNLFNLSLEEARSLGAIIDCDYFLIVKNETLPRSSFAKNAYFEADTIVFLVSGRTGRLIAWENKYFEADAEPEAVKMQLADLPGLVARLAKKINAAALTERAERARIKPEVLKAEELLAEEKEGNRTPLPYRSLRPEYTAVAGRLNIEATVDVEATIDERGEAREVEVVRWAGFDLDEAAALTVKKMQFRPALRDGKAVPARVLLRYNFREIKK